MEDIIELLGKRNNQGFLTFCHPFILRLCHLAGKRNENCAYEISYKSSFLWSQTMASHHIKQQ